MLSKNAIQDFKNIFKEEYGKNVSDAEALELGINLLTFFNHIYRPVKKSWLKNLVNKDCQQEHKKL